MPVFSHLSDGQMSNWYIERLENGSNKAASSNNITAAFELIGPLDGSRLCIAIEEVVEQSGLVRYAFSEIDGTPVQYLFEPPAFHVEQITLRREQIKANLNAFSQATFDLSKGNLLSFRLIKVEPQLSILAFCIHHLVCDGISIKLLLKSISARYNGIERNVREIPDYIEFCKHQKLNIDNGRFENQLDFWKSLLQGKNYNLALNISKSIRPKGTL
nr:condensation domain-containing protein [Pseudoalteromonas sp. S16_S37]